MPPRNRWTDDRLDDMKDTVDQISKRQDANSNLLAAVDLKVTEFEREKRLDDNRRWDVKLMLAGLMLTEIASVVLLIIKVH